MSERKGKNVLRNNNHDQDGPVDGSSLAQRVLASARGLATSFTTPDSSEIGQQLAASSNDDKIQWASNNVNGSSPVHGSTSSHLSHEDTRHSVTSPTFRTHQQQHIASTEQEFSDFLDGVDSLTAPVTRFDVDFDIQDFKENHVESNDTNIYHSASINQTDIARQEAQDGQDVLALLSSAGTNPAEQWEVYNQSIEEEPVIWNMTARERDDWQSRLRLDFPSSITNHEMLATNSSLNLLPTQDFDSAEDRDIWIQQWRGVLDRYVDEVWGNMLPLVEGAREELDRLKNHETNSAPASSKALRRLGLVLGHLRHL